MADQVEALFDRLNTALKNGQNKRALKAADESASTAAAGCVAVPQPLLVPPLPLLSFSCCRRRCRRQMMCFSWCRLPRLLCSPEGSAWRCGCPPQQGGEMRLAPVALLTELADCCACPAAE